MNARSLDVRDPHRDTDRRGPAPEAAHEAWPFLLLHARAGAWRQRTGLVFPRAFPGCRRPTPRRDTPNQHGGPVRQQSRPSDLVVKDQRQDDPIRSAARPGRRVAPDPAGLEVGAEPRIQPVAELPDHPPSARRGPGPLSGSRTDPGRRGRSGRLAVQPARHREAVAVDHEERRRPLERVADVPLRRERRGSCVLPCGTRAPRRRPAAGCPLPPSPALGSGGGRPGPSPTPAPAGGTRPPPSR